MATDLKCRDNRRNGPGCFSSNNHRALACRRCVSIHCLITKLCFCNSVWKPASACNRDTIPTQPHRISNTQRTKNITTNVVIQQHSRKLLMMGILMSETCWAHKKWNKIASNIKLVFHSSTMRKEVCFQKPSVPTNINYVCIVESNIWSYFVRNIAVIELHNFYKMCKWNDTFGTIPKILRWPAGIEIHHMRETMKGFCLRINFLHSGIKALICCCNRRDWSSNCSLDLHWNTCILSEKQYFPFEAVYFDRQRKTFFSICYPG